MGYTNPDLRLAYLRAEKNCGLKIGDKVRVKFKVKDHTLGWACNWADQMDEFIGKEFKILEFGNTIYNSANIRSRGILLDTEYQNYWFPYFCLEKVK